MSFRRASYTPFPCLPSIFAKFIAISLGPTPASHDEYKKARSLVEGSSINQIGISKKMAMSRAAVEHDIHPLQDMPNSFLAIDNSSFVANESQIDSFWPMGRHLDRSSCPTF